MNETTDTNYNRWWAMALVAALVTPVFTVLWLGVTLTSTGENLPTAVVKIVFTIIAVGTAALGVKWRTASGMALLVEFVVVVVWMLLKAEIYSQEGLVRTSLLLAAPLAVSGVLYVLAGGMEAGTWPPTRSDRAARGDR